MSKKHRLIKGICDKLKGSTAINFQMKIKEVLKKYYEAKNKTFEMPRPQGGDKKNDGYVREDNTYYQIFSPIQEKNNLTLKKEILKKLENDLKGLLEILYKEERWTKKLDKFIFLVNTFDNELPEDSNNEYEEIRKKYEDLYKEYKLNFTLDVKNIEYIRDILKILSEDDLEEITEYLDLSYLNDTIDNIRISDVYDVICEISSNFFEKDFKLPLNKDYIRISSEEKIHINDLKNKRERINEIISKLDTVEKAIEILSNNIEDNEKFESAKEYIIKTYKKLRTKFTGDILYDKIIEKITKFLKNGKAFSIPVEYLVVYIFDRCDIFEKEKEANK